MSDDLKTGLDTVLEQAQQAFEKFHRENPRGVTTPPSPDLAVRDLQIRRLLRRGIRLRSAEIIVDGKLIETAAMIKVRRFCAGRDGTTALCGPRGCGKSVAVSWAVSEPPNWPYLGDHPDGKNGHWPVVYSPRFVDASQLWRIWRSEHDLRDAVLNCSLLAVDDVGTECADEKGWFKSIVDEMIVTRHDSRLKTLLTSNMKPTEFGERYGERVSDRINSSGKCVGLQGPSLRTGA